jgi:pimeloyl-ACP methyl ester carboxylesterase
MLTAQSKDGTRIAYWRSGGGPPLLLVHGAIADHSTTWRLVLPQLERRFTVFAMDRRGRGGSGDSTAYALAREAEDVAAVVESIGGPVSVLGHSFGGLCALEAALLTPHVKRLVLYEGVYLRGSDGYRPGLIERLEGLLAAGDVEGMLVAMLRELVDMPPEEVELLRGQKEAWARRLSNAPTIPRELRADAGYRFNAERFRSLRAPILFLVGGDSPGRESQNAETVARTLPDARVAVLPGQQHLAMFTAPDAFVGEVVRFLEG